MRRSNIKWNEDKWDKFMSKVNVSYAFIHDIVGDNDEELMDFEALLLMIKKRQAKRGFVNDNFTNRHYSLIRLELSRIDGWFNINSSQHIKRWWV